jgi:transposase
MDVPVNIRHLIVRHCLLGKSSREIAEILNICKSTVNNVLKRFKKTGNVMPTRAGKCGRHRLLSEGDERLLRRASVVDPTLTANELRTCVGGSVSRVSISTVRRTLVRRGRFSYRPRKCPTLTPAQMRVRLIWCRKNCHRTEQQWKKVRQFL